MIVAVRSNMPSFKDVEFAPGFNVVLADRTKESSERESRNGLGKTTLIEIIHFCLGSSAQNNKGLLVPQLKGWSFTVELRVNDRQLTVTRSTEEPGWINLNGDIGDWGNQYSHQSGTLTFRVSDWNSKLGGLFFNLSNQEAVLKYQPTFRSLFSYLVRHGGGGFISPFTHHKNQKEWDKQVNNAYLLGLTWEHASQLQELKDEENLLNSLRRAAQSGLIEGMVGTLGNLEAERARLESLVKRQSESLRSFRVHPQYHEIEREANELTSKIHQLSNANLIDGRLLDLYRESLEEDHDPEVEEVHDIYQAIGITMPYLVRRRLAEVQDFHRQILANRRAYLKSELQRIEFSRSQRELQLQEAIERRAQLLVVLETHGALQEYTQLQELYLGVIASRHDINNRIANLKRFEQGKSEVRVKRELLLQSARRDFEERRLAREDSINIFNANSEVLYDAPGNLVLAVTNTGFSFDVEILRSGSQGIDNMKIFCYDLMLARLWARKQPFTSLLIHDSTIFDGVDERQVAHALELAKVESERWGFQYVCALNTDTLPSREFSPDFDLNGFVRLCITDESEEGGLLGIRY